MAPLTPDTLTLRRFSQAGSSLSLTLARGVSAANGNHTKTIKH